MNGRLIIRCAGGILGITLIIGVFTESVWVAFPVGIALIIWGYVEDERQRREKRTRRIRRLADQKQWSPPYAADGFELRGGSE